MYKEVFRGDHGIEHAHLNAYIIYQEGSSCFLLYGNVEQKFWVK